MSDDDPPWDIAREEISEKGRMQSRRALHSYSAFGIERMYKSSRKITKRIGPSDAASQYLR